MKTMSLHKLWNAVGNGLWQLIPSLSVMLLSLIIVRLFSTAIWGTIVSIIVIQQIANSVTSWGNKDFLQRELAGNMLQFSQNFTGFFRERFYVFIGVVLIIFFFRIIEPVYFTALALLIFGRFIQQSFDILIIKERRFSLAVSLEISMLALQIFGIWMLHIKGFNDIDNLLMLFWIPLLIKSLVLTIVFWKYFVFAKSEHLFLGSAFSFAMLSLTGLVHSKIDLVLISVSLDHETLGKYQIITAFLWNIQSVALYVSSPYIHHFYRLNAASQNNYAMMLKRIGLVLVPIGVGCMAFLLHYAFHIQIGPRIFIASMIFGIMSFIYLPQIFQMNQNKREHYVLWINISGIAILMVLMLAFKKIIGLTLENTIWIITIHQVFLTCIAFIVNKNSKKHE